MSKRNVMHTYRIEEEKRERASKLFRENYFRKYKFIICITKMYINFK